MGFWKLKPPASTITHSYTQQQCRIRRSRYIFSIASLCMGAMAFMAILPRRNFQTILLDFRY